MNNTTATATPTQQQLARTEVREALQDMATFAAEQDKAWDLAGAYYRAGNIEAMQQALAAVEHASKMQAETAKVLRNLVGRHFGWQQVKDGSFRLYQASGWKVGR
jgi:hypothetical protein